MIMENNLKPFQKDYIKTWKTKEILEDFIAIFDFSKEEENLAKQILEKYEDWWNEDMWK